MLNYIFADLRRIVRRIPRAIAVTVIIAILAAVLVIYKSTSDQFTSVAFVLGVKQYLGFLPVLIGLVEMMSVFTEDFRAKTMQVAIGIGIPRYQIVLSKIIEAMALVLCDLLVIAALTLIMAPVLSVSLNASQMLELSGSLLGIWLGVTAYISLTGILIFFTQGTGIATILYIALASGVINMIFGLIFSIEAIAGLQLQRITLTTMIKQFDANAALGIFNFSTFFGILIYILAGVGITVAVFQKRELEF